MIQHIPVQYLCSENNYHFSRFTHDLGREVPSLLDVCLSFYAKNIQLLQTHMNSIPAELIQLIYNYMITNNLLSPKDLHLFRTSMRHMTIDGSVENGEDFLASYCYVQRQYNHQGGRNHAPSLEDCTKSHSSTTLSSLSPSSPTSPARPFHIPPFPAFSVQPLSSSSSTHTTTTVTNHTPPQPSLPSPPPSMPTSPSHTDQLDERCSEPENDTIDVSNSYFNINKTSGSITCNNNYFYVEDDYQLHVLFGKSIQTTLFDLKEARMVTDLALDDFEDDQVLKKLPSNLKHLSVRWCKLSGNDSLSFLNDYSHTLQSLRLSSVELKSLRFLSELTSLTFLDLSINPGIQDSEICWLSKLSKLTTLDLDATGITSKVIPIITQSHPNLVCLNLSGTLVDTKGLEEALVLKNLKVISVMSTQCKCPYPVPAIKDLIIIGDFMTKQDARDAAQYSSFFSRAVQLRLIFGYYKLVANSRSRPHWPWFVQNILDMAKSSIRNEKLVEMALLFLWGEVCGEATPDDLLNVAHKPVIESVTTICEHEGITTISKIMEYYVRNHRANGKNVLLFAIGLLTVASHNNKMSQTLMYQNKIVSLVLEAFQTYEKTEPSFQKFVLGVLLQLSANVQCHAQIASQKVLQMCVLECLNIKEYVRNNLSHNLVLALRGTAVLYNLSCWRANTTKLLDSGALESIAEILSTSEMLSTNKQSMADLLEASAYFDPLAIATLANLCRKGACSVYAFPRWQKVINLAVECFKRVIRSGQLQASPPSDLGYAFCSINNWDLTRSVIALFVNSLTVEPYWSQKFREAWINSEIINLLLQYACIVDAEGHILLSFLFCLILDGSPTDDADLMTILEQLDQSKERMSTQFPSRFCSYIWKDLGPVQALCYSTRVPEVQEWCITFLEAGSKTNLLPDMRTFRVPKRLAERTCEPPSKRQRSSRSPAGQPQPDSAT